MNITTKVSHTVTFTIEAFWNEEGGMGHDQLGGTFDDLTGAIRGLEIARLTQSTTEWVIVCRVKTQVS